MRRKYDIEYVKGMRLTSQGRYSLDNSTIRIIDYICNYIYANDTINMDSSECSKVQTKKRLMRNQLVNLVCRGRCKR